MRAVDDAAPTIGLQIRILNASTIREIDAIFAGLVRERPDALFVAPDAFFAEPGRAVRRPDRARSGSHGPIGTVILS